MLKTGARSSRASSVTAESVPEPRSARSRPSTTPATSAPAPRISSTTPRTAVIRTVNDSKPSSSASEMIGISMYFVPSPVLFHDTVPDTAVKSSLVCAVPSMAASLGVNTRLVDAATFSIGSGLAGLAGCTLTWIGLVGPSLGQNYIVNAFMTVVVGGAGSILGTIFGAAFIGIGQSAFEFLTDASVGQVLIFLCIIVLLQFKPKGLFETSTRSLED